MRIYLASRCSRREELCGYRAQLEELGHTVTSRWLNGDHQIDDQGLSVEASREERERFAKEDFQDLIMSELCISFTEPPRSTNSRGGRHVEFGIAFGRMMRTWVVGPRENVFHCMEDVLVLEDFGQCIARLKGKDPLPRVWWPLEGAETILMELYNDYEFGDQQQSDAIHDAIAVIQVEMMKLKPQ